MIAKRVEHTLPTGGGLAHSDCGPTVLRILLGVQLRRLRTAGNVTRKEAGAALRVSAAKISRLEQGRVNLTTREVGNLLSLYGVTDRDQRAALLLLTEQVSIRGWWHRYGEALSSWSEVYDGLEEAASIIRTFDIQYVPSLLQTADYARVVIQLAHAPVRARAHDLDQRLNLLMRRQKRLTGPEAPRLWAVVDEAALRRPYGDPQVMRAQMDHLIKMTTLPNITLSVVPFARDAHPAAGGPFTILRFAGPELPDVVYLEQLTSALYFDKHEDTHHYMEVMDRLSLEASSPSTTPELLARLRDKLT